MHVPPQMRAPNDGMSVKKDHNELRECNSEHCQLPYNTTNLYPLYVSADPHTLLTLAPTIGQLTVLVNIINMCNLDRLGLKYLWHLNH